MEPIGENVRDFILKEFLPDEDPSELTEDTPLIQGGILDSLATLKVVSFLEEQYDIKILPYETDEENFGSIASIENLIKSKL